MSGHVPRCAVPYDHTRSWIVILQINKFHLISVCHATGLYFLLIRQCVSKSYEFYRDYKICQTIFTNIDKYSNLPKNIYQKFAPKYLQKSTNTLISPKIIYKKFTKKYLQNLQIFWIRMLLKLDTNNNYYKIWCIL